MEETDTIIVETLKWLGCDVDESITSLGDFPVELVIEGVVKCLKLIKPELAHLSHKMPPNLSAQYKLCMDLATECENIGLRSHLGYETFLHGSQTDIRNIFLSLINKLPKANEQPVLENIDVFQQLLLSCKRTTHREINKPWLPSFCMPKKATFSFHSCDLNSKGGYSSLSDDSMSVIIPTLIEKHIFDLAKEKYLYQLPERKQSTNRSHRALCATHVLYPSRFSLLYDFNFRQDGEILNKKKPPLPPKPVHFGPTKQEEVAVTKRDECEEVRQAIQGLEIVLTEREKILCSLTEESNSSRESIESCETEVAERNKEVDRLEKLYIMAKNAPEHLERMENMLSVNQEKMEDLKSKWEELKQPLEDEYAELLREQRSALGDSLKTELEELVSSFQKVVAEVHEKQEKLQVLENRVESLPPSPLNRTFYTQRILSIVANVKKQNEEMNRLIEEIKQVQREINGLQGKIERTFTVTDEIMFTVAKGDEAVRRVYKNLLSLHTDCNDILRMIKETGTLTRDIKDLENQVETESRKNTESKLRKTLSDLQQIRQENQALEEKLQGRENRDTI